VDDVNASHLNANDLIVHFGRCCLSTQSKKEGGKEILYVLPKSGSDSHMINDALIDGIKRIEGLQEVYVMPDVEWVEKGELIKLTLREHIPSLEWIQIGLIDNERFNIIPKIN
jgi:diphthamide biosynthesis enzyme Dph1/Dph2-like protein